MKFILLVCLLISLLSCSANHKSIYRITSIPDEYNSTKIEHTIVSVDAKQRHLISATNSSGKKVFCSEPSPDVFSVIASSIEANAEYADKWGLALKSATSENGGSIGLRTESIQLLRDAMYRLCEAHANDGIGKTQYETLLEKYQRSMVTLVAIAQLTNAAMPAQLVLSADSSVELNNQVFKAKQNLDESRSNLTTAQSEYDQAKKDLDTADTNVGDKPEDICTEENLKKPENEAKKEPCSIRDKAIVTEKDKKDKLALAERDVNEDKQVFDTAKNAVKISANTDHAAILHNQQRSNSEVSKEAITAVQEMVEKVFLDTTIHECTSALISLAKRSKDLIYESANIPINKQQKGNVNRPRFFIGQKNLNLPQLGINPSSPEGKSITSLQEEYLKVDKEFNALTKFCSKAIEKQQG